MINRSLEIEKLRLEIAQLKRPWWRRLLLEPSTAIAIIAASGTIATGYITGFFDVQTQRAENARDKASLDLEKLNAGKTALHAEIAGLKGTVKQLNREVAQKQAEKSALEGALVRAQKELSQQAHITEACRTEVAGLLSRVASQSARNEPEFDVPVTLSGGLSGAGLSCTITSLTGGRVSQTSVELGRVGTSKQVRATPGKYLLSCGLSGAISQGKRLEKEFEVQPGKPLDVGMP